MPERRRRFFIPLLAILGLALVVAVWWGTRPKEEDGQLLASGTIEATELPVSAEVAGKVLEVSAGEGQRVEAGAVLARLDASALELQAEQAEAGLRVAEARRDEAKRLSALSPAVTPEQIKQLEGAVDQAAAALKLAQLAVKRATVAAPISGTILRRLVEPGALVPGGAPLFTMANLDDLWLRVYVPEDELGRVSLGKSVRVEVDSFPGRSFRAEVAWISEQAEFTPRNVQTAKERATTVYAVKLRLREGLGGQLKPGMPADVEFPSGASQ
jgi:HlyD family secretion protein